MNRRDVILAGAAMAATPAFAAPGIGGIRMPASVADSELRGLSPTGGKTYWASGSKGWLIRGRDERQDPMRIIGAEDLDFRGLHAFDDHHVLAMSAGPGGASQLWRTQDGGKTWKRLAANQDPDGFWDSIAFVDKRRGFILGDPTQGRFTVLYTADGGETWARLPPEGVPPAAEGRGRSPPATAASPSAAMARWRSAPAGRAWRGSICRAAAAGSSWRWTRRSSPTRPRAGLSPSLLDSAASCGSAAATTRTPGARA
ncbi:YCF48-related protein [Caulobacter sp. RL271]|uniref:YCF48-related protein n=1 Tax=Caulobacter segnis TaxID=88688 RepID=A0ABY4ZWI1_9CAUL|nr:YCF48-related protein [Caulobacter segnis]USQ96928.1 YCF48-related protein [Caulobacter segnis]